VGDIFGFIKMYLAHRWRDRNLTRLELVSALLLISLIIFFISKRALVVFVVAEKNHIDYTITNINTALQLKTFSYLTRNNMESLLEMVDANPMRLMENESSENLVEFYQDYDQAGVAIKQLYAAGAGNYLGELFDPDINEIKKGSWYFDLATKKLVYIIKNHELFYTDLPGIERLVFSVNIYYDDVNVNNAYDYQIDKLNHVKLRAENHYEWQL
jgi:hypothetical protein